MPTTIDQVFIEKLPWKVEENFNDKSFFVMIDDDNYDDIILYAENEEIAEYIVSLHNSSIAYIRPKVILEEREVKINDCTFIPEKKRIINGEGKEFYVRLKESKLLQLLYINRHRIVSTESIAHCVWGQPLNFSLNNIHMAIYNLRRALGKETIINYKEIGYKLCMDEE